MFPNRYFAARYFGDRYFPPASAPLITTVASPGNAIVSIPNWGVPYKLPSYMKAIHYAPQRWKVPRYKKPF